MKSILIVDDESRLLQSIQAGLRTCRENFSVLTALDGREAMAILADRQIDLVVTDLRMPEVDGFELLAHISQAYPFLPTIVMTAFATPEIEERISNAGSLVLLEKPLDFDRLAEAIIDGLEQSAKDGTLAGISLASFMQLLAMEQKTCLLQIVSGSGEEGYMYFEGGDLIAAIAGEDRGEEAVYRMLAHDNVSMTFRKIPTKKVRRQIFQPMMSVLLEGVRRKDEAGSGPAGFEAGQGPADLPDLQSLEDPEDESISEAEGYPPPANDHQQIKGDQTMAQLDETLGKLKDVEGFMAVGIFTPNGEMAAQVNASGIKLAEVGALANDVLLKAQKASDLMNVGRGHIVHVEAPKAHVIARCLNESEDYATTAAGKAHLHMVLILSKDGNLAMAKIKLEAVILEAAASFR